MFASKNPFKICIFQLKVVLANFIFQLQDQLIVFLNYRVNWDLPFTILALTIANSSKVSF